jgi:hypothetical protein
MVPRTYGPNRQLGLPYRSVQDLLPSASAYFRRRGWSRYGGNGMVMLTLNENSSAVIPGRARPITPAVPAMRLQQTTRDNRRK